MNSVTEQPLLKERLLADFQTLDNQAGPAPSFLHRLRREAIRQFDRLGFPTTRHEEWKYTNVAPLTKQAFALHAAAQVSAAELAPLQIPGLETNVLVFVNGQYQASLSKVISPADQLRVLDLSTAATQLPELFEQHFAQSTSFENEAFSVLNTAFAQHGAFIHVPAGKVVDLPVVLYFVTDARREAVAIQPRNLFIAGRNSQAKVVEIHQTLGDQSNFTNLVTEISLESDAHLEYYKVQNESNGTYHIDTTQVSQQNNSHYYGVTVTVNGGFIRNNLRTVLDGQGCEANLFGLYLPNEKQLIDNHTTVDHAKPNSYSNELYKGILDGQSTGVFNGKIYVRQDAQKTNAFQSNRNIVLSNGAAMNTKPQLEIYADDVKCSHGSTTGQMDEDALFYLRARGISLENAKALLMVAFAGDVLNQVRIPALKEYLSSEISRKLEQS